MSKKKTKADLPATPSKKKKKKTYGKKDRSRGRFNLRIVEAVGLLPWPRHWGMREREGPLNGAHMVELTSKPCTVTVGIFEGTPGMFTPDHKLPNVFSMEMSMEDAKALGEKLIKSADDARALAKVWKTQ